MTNQYKLVTPFKLHLMDVTVLLAMIWQSIRIQKTNNMSNTCLTIQITNIRLTMALQNAVIGTLDFNHIVQM